MSIAYVVTTIFPPSAGVKAIAHAVRTSASDTFYVIGDAKTPHDWQCQGVVFLSLDEQRKLPFRSASLIPENSYTRKMIGYLLAAASGFAWIRETDDDNHPYGKFFDPVPARIRGRLFAGESSGDQCWVNVYSFFSDRFIWPRGFPLARVRGSVFEPARLELTREFSGPFVFQALADGDPDVDSIYRLTSADQSQVVFAKHDPLVLPRDTWSPFNSQATTWPRALLPLMYLPATCSFRMTDIWRSLIAQRLMHVMNIPLVITSATVFQDRNSHNLMSDFRDEVEGFVGYERFVKVILDAKVVGGAGQVLADLASIYDALIEARFFTASERIILGAWLQDMRDLGFPD